MVAATAISSDSGAASSSALSPQSSALLSPLDQALLTRLYETAAPGLPALLDSLSESPIEGAPTSLFALTQWAQTDHIRPWIDIRSAQHREDLQREMVALLKEIAKNSESQVERRRAATTILRTLHGGPLLRGVRASPDSRGGGGRNGRGAPDEGLPARAAPLPRGTPRLRPSPSLTHYDVICAVSASLAKPTDPDSHATLETFLAEGATIQSQPVTCVAAQIDTKRRGEVSQHIGPYVKYDEIWDESSNICTYQVLFNQKPHFVHVTLRRSPASPHPNSWLIASIHTDSS